MKRWIWLFFPGLALGADVAFNQYFEAKTMRIDYVHTGTSENESFAFDAVYEEPVWPGSRLRLVDSSGLGDHCFKVFMDGVVVYSDGFSSIFKEWQTTEEANRISRAFGESIRFPWPKKPVQILIESRDTTGYFRSRWTLDVDPGDVGIRRERFYSDCPVRTILSSGDPERTVDLVILPDGYRRKEMKKFRKDAERLVEAFFFREPYMGNRDRFSVRLVEIPSNESGIDVPQDGIYVDNALGSSFHSLETDRYVLTYDNATLRKAASVVPYDAVMIMANSNRYGGGGIYNQYATVTSDGPSSDYVFVHELSHAFAGLGDEYYTSEVSYNEFYPRGIEPWEPNLTQCRDRTTLKWRDLVSPDTPIPTPWNQEEYDRLEAEYRSAKTDPKTVRADSLDGARRQKREAFMREHPMRNRVGTFEGAGYSAKGIYRPSLDCTMFSRILRFDPVCARAIQRMIDWKTQ